MADSSQQFAQLIQQQQAQQQAQLTTQQQQQQQLQQHQQLQQQIQQQQQQQQQQGGAGSFAASSAHPPQAQAVQSQLQAGAHRGIPGSTAAATGAASNSQAFPTAAPQGAAHSSILMQEHLQRQTLSQPHQQQQIPHQQSQTPQMQQQYAHLQPYAMQQAQQAQQLQMHNMHMQLQARQTQQQSTVLPLGHGPQTANTHVGALATAAPIVGAAAQLVPSQQPKQMAFAMQQQALRNNPSSTQTQASRQLQQVLQPQQRASNAAATSMHPAAPGIRPVQSPHILLQQQQFQASRANHLSPAVFPPGSAAALQQRQFAAAYASAAPAHASTSTTHALPVQPSPPTVHGPLPPAPVLTVDDRRAVSLRGLAVAMRLAGLDKLYVLDEATQTALLAIYDDLLDSSIEFGCLMAKKRKVGAGANPVLQPRDMAQHFGRGYGLSIPGFGGDMLKPYKRRTGSSEIHRARMAAVRLTAQKLEEGVSEPAVAAAVSKAGSQGAGVAAAAAVAAGAGAAGGAAAAELQAASKGSQPVVAGIAAVVMPTKV